MLDGLTRRGTLVLGMLVTLISAAADSSGGTDSLQGSSSRTAAVEVELEQRFDSGLSAAGYYQGLESVLQNGEEPSTEQYVSNVLALQQQFGAE